MLDMIVLLQKFSDKQVCIVTSIRSATSNANIALNYMLGSYSIHSIVSWTIPVTVSFAGLVLKTHGCTKLYHISNRKTISK